MPSLTSLFASADNLHVDAVAQVPWCVEPARQDPGDAFRIAGVRGFDVLPVLDSDGGIRQTITRDQLRGATSWEAVLADAAPLTADRLVARESPALALLDRLDIGKALFALGPAGVDGIVTIYDLNQPAAHLLAFGMALICEADLADVLRNRLGEDPDVAYEAALNALQPYALRGRPSRTKAGRKRETSGLRRWRNMQKHDQNLHIASTLSYGEKVAAAEVLAADALAQAHGVSSDVIFGELRHICELRNAIGHYEDDNEEFEDAEWVFQRLRAAQHYAQRVINRGMARPDGATGWS